MILRPTNQPIGDRNFFAQMVRPHVDDAEMFLQVSRSQHTPKGKRSALEFEPGKL